MGEKFVAWTDESTGIHPFLPAENKLLYGESKETFLSKIIGIPLAIIRFPLVMISLFSLFLFDFILGYIPILGKLLNRLNHFIFGRLALFFLGYSIKLSYCQSKKGNRPPKNQSPGSEIQNGHLIICNHTSYIDILVLTYWFSPQFTTIPSKGNGILPLSLFSAFKNSITNEYPSGNGISIKEFINTYGKSKPTVVFPEGTTTNGQVLLGCQPIFDEPIGLEKSKIHILGISYDDKRVKSSFTVERFLIHIFRLCTQISNTVKGTLILNADIPDIPIDYPNQWSDEILNLLARNALKIERGKIKRDQKFPFLKKYFKQNYKKTE